MTDKMSSMKQDLQSSQEVVNREQMAEIKKIKFAEFPRVKQEKGEWRSVYTQLQDAG